MNFSVNNEEILKKYNAIWDKINCLFKKQFDSKPVYNNKYIKAKINSYNTNFYGNKTPKTGEHHTCLSVMLLDSIVNVDKKYYPQMFLEQCKYAVNAINEELNLDESDDDNDESGEQIYICK